MTEAQPPALAGPRRWALSLYLLPSPLIVEAMLSLWSGNFTGVLTSTAAYGLFVAAAQLIRHGSEAETARKRAARRRWPWKTLGAVVTGIASGFTAAVEAGHDVPIAIAFGVVAAIGARLVYGGDEPLSLSAPPRAGDADEAVLGPARLRLERIEALARSLPSPEFRLRLASIADQVGDLITAVEQEPSNLALTRRFFNVYLDHSVEVMESYARVFPASGSADLEHSFRSLLVNIENTCEQQRRSLLQRDLLDLDVQIEVLNQRLQQEGLR
jgi:hypothetical protein